MKEFLEQPKKQEKKIEDITASVFKDEEGQTFNSPSENLHDLKENKDPDLAREIFKEINPLGLMLSDVKMNLEKEIQEQEAALQELKRLQGEGDDYKNFIGDMEKKIIKNKWWIMKIDDFLTDRNVEDLRKLIPNQN
jgi:hypothetical protein